MLRREECSIPAVHALHLAELIERWGVAADELFAGLGIQKDALADPAQRISIPVVEELVARARSLTGEPGLGFYLGLQMRISSHGYLGFAAMAASTVGEALELACRFAPTRTTALGLRLDVDGDTASLVIEERVPLGSAEDVIILCLLVGIRQIGDALTGRALEGFADVRFPEPEYAKRFQSRMGGRLRFGQPAHRLVFDASVLNLPLVMADPAALRLAREQCERELDAHGFTRHFSARTRGFLSVEGGGFRSLDEVAALLHVSPRTLKRRLASEGAAFSDLLDEERRQRALLLLRSPELSLESIADLLGYSDVANFTRAFRRWTGLTPGAFRRGGGIL
ncbi:MAG: AraC family transcriptional regulator [Polyangiaceae bacterium]|nr:AraC family transcriptional regulator [Polyangiaceae bacterium]